MTTLTPILYADGALRLTDHGPRGGGAVLVRTDTNEQVDIPAGCSALTYLERDIKVIGAALAFITLKHYVREWHERQALQPQRSTEGFHHFYHG